ncbi:hypothetical protein H0H92_006013, partial [Tricholoma furcatifolium]
MAPKSDPQRMEFLGQCSLVSSWWFVRARHWMFDDVGIEIGPEDFDIERTRQLIELLQTSQSTIARDLRYVKICYYENSSYIEQLNKLIVAVLPHMKDRIPLELSGVLWDRLSKPAQASILRLQPASLSMIYHSRSLPFDLPTDILALSSKISPSLEVLHIEKHP